MKATPTRMLLVVVALAGCAAGEVERPEPLQEREAAITGCAAKSVTTVATVVYDYDLAGRQTRDRDAKLLYDPWNQLKEVQLNTTTSPKYNNGRTVVAEKHTYGYDGTRTSTTTNPGAANAAVRVQITPDDVIHDGKREHYVRIGNRIVARLAMTASGTLALNGPPGAPGGGDRLPAGLHLSPALTPPPPWQVLALAALVLGAATVLSWRRRRRWAPSLAGVALLAASCQMFGAGVIGNSSALLLAEKTYFHSSLGPGPSLITRQDGTILEERRFEPFGVPIDAFRTGRAGAAPVDLVTDPQSIVGKQADASNGFTDHGARWLSSQSGRWLTPDPAVTGPNPRALTKPWDLNAYAYAGQNPMIYWDPDGQDPAIVNNDYLTGGAHALAEALRSPPASPPWADKYSIQDRSNFYRGAHSVLNAQPWSTHSKWFGIASLTTSSGGVGGVDYNLFLRMWTVRGGAVDFLRDVNQRLFPFNNRTFELLKAGKEIPGLEGLHGRELDYGLVVVEQGLIQTWIDQLPADKRSNILKGVQGAMSSVWGNKELTDAVKSFGGKFDFGNLEDRIELGKKLIDRIYDHPGEMEGCPWCK